MNPGKKIRLEKLIDKESGKMVFIPIDDGLIDGPEQGLLYQEKKIKEIVAGGANGMLGFKRIAQRHYNLLGNTGLVLNLTASLSGYNHTRKVLVGSVEEALRLGAVGVGVHVNVTSKYESEMLKILGEISDKCDAWGMPLLALMYPRTEGKNSDNNYDELLRDKPEEYAKLVRHAARVGVELGADIIKTKYTGNPETFKSVIDACDDVPVIIAGGPKVSDEKILENIYGAIQAGGAGCCVGRNGFNRDNTTDFVKAAREIVHNKKTVEEALNLLM